MKVAFGKILRIETVLLFVLTTLIFGAYIAKASERDNPATLLPSDILYWESQIKLIGAETAYTQLAIQYADDPGIAGHTQGHAFGEALYKLNGFQNFPICGTAFPDNNGCFHAIISMHILANGTNTILDLFELCPSELTKECAHGIGHGLVDYLGKDNVIPGAQECEKLQEEAAVAECQIAAYMESFEFGFNDTDSTSLANVDFLTPCNTGEVPDEYKFACYYSLPKKWNSIIERSQGRMLCHTKVPEQYQQECLGGLTRMREE